MEKEYYLHSTNILCHIGGQQVWLLHGTTLRDLQKCSTYFVCNHHCVFVIAIVTGEFTILILRKYGFKVCATSLGFWSSYLKVYINLTCINKQQQTASPFPSWWPLSRVSLLYWYCGNTVLRFVWHHLVFIRLILKFISIYPASIHSDKQHHYFICGRHCHGWVYYIDTTKIRF